MKTGRSSTHQTGLVTTTLTKTGPSSKHQTGLVTTTKTGPSSKHQPPKVFDLNQFIFQQEERGKKQKDTSKNKPEREKITEKTDDKTRDDPCFLD